MSVVICAEELGKKYRRGLATDSGLRHALERFARSPISVFRRNRHEDFWALKDVSLEVHEGEVLGLVGRNGAGKTTLLKILSRITKPTKGWAEIRGRVGSLLEVGTGFHPELTGRENAFLSGAILGMRKAEIVSKFDEIVEFAELDKFIDTPVKHYSSGMYVRLAFAVAAHLEPEILLVDEVLAVGDINFQKKCLGKMGDAARAGRTILLVSHQLNQIRRLCHRVVWMDAGGVRKSGPAPEVVGSYEASARADEGEGETRAARGRAHFKHWELVGANDGQSNILDQDGEVRLKFSVRVNEQLRDIHHGVALYDQERQLIWANAIEGLSLEPGVHELVCTLASLPIRPGVYEWRASLYDKGEPIDDWACLPPMFVSTRPRTHMLDQFTGVLNIPSEFTNQLVATQQTASERFENGVTKA